MTLISANGILSLLNDKSDDVKGFALNKLFEEVDVFWPEIAEEISCIETLYEDSSFKYNKVAALLVSKVYYHLSEFKESLNFALCSEEYFDKAGGQYRETIIQKCVDEYVSLRKANYLNPDNIDYPNFTRLEQVVNRMFEKCFLQDQHSHVMGIAIESRRLDMFERAIETAHMKEEMLKHAFTKCVPLIQNKHFRNQILLKLVRLYNTLPNPDYINMCQCLIFLDDANRTAEILDKLISNEESAAMAYQIAFDIYENATQQFMNKIIMSWKILTNYQKLFVETKEEDGLNEDEKAMKVRYVNLNSILTGEKVIDLHLQFLIKNNHTDMKILERIKGDVRHSITHNATVIANGLMHYGTTSDQFLRDNLDWLGRAVNWAKFTATATLGVIHKGHEKEALKLMSTYLPKENSTGSGTTTGMYTEGGALYALGLMHANHGGVEMTEYLLKQLHDATTEPVRHGGCLGLGLAAMGTSNADVYEQMKSNLYQDDAVTGEAAGIGMGLVMLGSGSVDVVNDMIGYAKETAHEKIVRGLALGIALIMYGQQEEADGVIDALISEKFPILRWAGMATIGMAYCGTGDNAALKKLLDAAVKDTSDDVRRWAMTSIGFLLFKSQEQIPALVKPLSGSHNGHVRYGAAMALGLGCAGTNNKEAVALLEPLLDDRDAFVRQGAYLATALIVMQQNGVSWSGMTEFRERLLRTARDRTEEIMAKFGAIVATGLLDAGGRNVSVSLQTRTGHANMCAAAGLLVFQNYWFWFPLLNFVTLAFSPSHLILLDSELRMPRIALVSKAKPGTFAYPEPLHDTEKEKKREKVETAVLSVTARQNKKKTAAAKIAMDTIPADAIITTTISKEPISKKDFPPAPAASTTVTEVDFSILQNPARVLLSQLPVIELSKDETSALSRYTPIKSIKSGGILLVRDQQPQLPLDIIEPVKPNNHDTDADANTAGEDNLPEPEAPQPFLFLEDSSATSANKKDANQHNTADTTTTTPAAAAVEEMTTDEQPSHTAAVDLDDKDQEKMDTNQDDNIEDDKKDDKPE